MSNIVNKNSVFFKSILVILIYFICPYIINAFSNVFGNSTIISITMYIMLFLSYIYIYRNTFKEDFKYINDNKLKLIKKILLYFFLVIISVFMLNTFIYMMGIEKASANDMMLYDLFKRNTVLTLLLTTIYYPIVEGIVYRKCIYDIIKNKYVFIVFSCMFYFVFNIVYTSLSFENAISSMFYILLMFYYSKIYVDTKNFTMSIIVCILYNIFVNLIAFA